MDTMRYVPGLEAGSSLPHGRGTRRFRRASREHLDARADQPATSLNRRPPVPPPRSAPSADHGGSKRPFRCVPM